MVANYFAFYIKRVYLYERLNINNSNMGLFESFFGVKDSNNSKNKPKDWDVSVFDTDRFRNRGSANWVDWEDVATGDVETDGFEDPRYDENGEW